MNAHRAAVAGNGVSSVVVEECQLCGSKNVEPVLFLGYMPPVNDFHAIGTTPAEQSSFPAQVLQCMDCDLVQLGLVVDPSVLFPPSYPYTSGTTRILRENFADLERHATEVLGLDKSALVIDIGSNDGTLLSNFQNAGYRVLGVEPTDVGQKARDRGIDTKQAFFGAETGKKVREEYGPAKLVTAANVFAHIQDPHGVVEGILELLDEDGVFISENHYLIPLLETLQYDTVYHEHLRYYSLNSLKNLFESHGMEVFEAKRIPTHGGSIRVFAGRKGQHEVTDAAKEIFASEPTGEDLRAELDRFRERVVSSKLEIYRALADIKSGGGRVVGISAPSRAATLVNYVGLDDGILDCLCEIKGSLKIGKYMPGTIIPVVDEEVLFAEDQPDAALILSWHIADELITILRKNGFKGKFIVPLPEVRVVE
ncbi:MAG: class I SAM-dependent methyltransferase [Rhizobiaceae bacterium]